MKIVLALVVAFTSSPLFANVIFTGNCANELVKGELLQDIVSGTVHIGSFAQLEQTLRDGGVDEVHGKNIATILDGVKRGGFHIQPLEDFLQFASVDALQKTLLVCVAGKDCKFSYGSSNTAAAYLRNHHRSEGLSFTSFDRLPQFGSSEWIELERRAMAGTAEYLQHGHPNPILVKVRRPEDDQMNRLDPMVGLDPLPLIRTFEGEVLHELVHAGDTELIRIWAEANRRLLARGEVPDELFLQFAKISPLTKRIFVADEFWTIFSETRAYQTTLEVWKLFKPDPEVVAHLTDQAYFAAWMYVMRSDARTFDAAEIAGLPTREDFKAALTGESSDLDVLIKRASRAMQATLEGRKSWRSIMLQTLQRAGF